jgi:hypothetical protein
MTEVFIVLVLLLVALALVLRGIRKSSRESAAEYRRLIRRYEDASREEAAEYEDVDRW